MSDTRPLGAIVLAAGLGTRMRSALAKVLHEIGDRPLLHYPLRALAPLQPSKVVVVVGHQADAVRKAALSAGLPGVETVLQPEQNGTGHAVRCAAPAFDGFDGDILILYGDVPFIQTDSLERLVHAHRTQSAGLSLLTVWFEDPTGYGRIVRDDAGRVRRIVEQKDADPTERAIKEINPGFYCIRSTALPLLDALRTNNAQGELYLTDLVSMVADRGDGVAAVLIDRPEEVAGINTRAELARMESTLRQATVQRWMDQGVTFVDPATAYVGADVTIGRDTIIGPNVVLRGNTTIGADCRLDGTCHLDGATVRDGARIGFGCAVRGTTIAARAEIAPFTRLLESPPRTKAAAPARTKAAAPARARVAAKKRNSKTKTVARSAAKRKR